RLSQYQNPFCLQQKFLRVPRELFSKSSLGVPPINTNFPVACKKHQKNEGARSLCCKTLVQNAEISFALGKISQKAFTLVSQSDIL
ncbi:MAG: hypothetical protein IJW69_01245, partial [Clostridia bacterium]|nr:hypothetical protein [Clostridia bacterium]